MPGEGSLALATWFRVWGSGLFQLDTEAGPPPAYRVISPSVGAGHPLQLGQSEGRPERHLPGLNTALPA